MPQGDADALKPDSPDTLEAGTVLGDYELVRALGKGGMAVVYEARHRALHKRVALKVLQATGRKADLSRRFLREAEHAARLSHPHVVDVSHVGTAQGLPYLVMEYLEGEDLGQHLEREGKLSVQATADLLVPVACAIAAAHESGVVHRDLKPQNVFLCKARGGGPTIPKVVDFGVSKLLDSTSLSLTDTDAILGTPFYMSPEQAMEAKHVDARTDQFSLGVILYECVTGHRPFAGDSLFSVLTAIVNIRQEPPSSLSYPMDPEFEALVERALEKKPEQRFASMQELGRELLRFASLRVQIATAAELGAEAPIARDANIVPLEIERVDPGAAQVSSARKASVRPSRAQSSLPANAASGRGNKPRSQPHSDDARKLLRWGTAVGTALTVAGVAAWLSSDAGSAHKAPPRPPAFVLEPASPPPAAAGTTSNDWESMKPSAPGPVTATQTASVNIEPASARVELDGVYVGTGSAVFDLPSDGAEHRMSVQAEGYEPVEVVIGAAAPPPATLVLRRLPAAGSAPLAPEGSGRARDVGASARARDAKSAQIAPMPSEQARPALQTAPAAAISAEPAPEPKPAAPAKSGEFQAFPAARGGKRPVRPLDTRDPWK